MEFKVNVSSLGFGHADMQIIEGDLTISGGLLNMSEREGLAAKMRRAAYELDSVEYVTKESARAAIDLFDTEDNSDDIDEALSVLEG